MAANGRFAAATARRRRRGLAVVAAWDARAARVCCDTSSERGFPWGRSCGSRPHGRALQDGIDTFLGQHELASSTRRVYRAALRSVRRVRPGDRARASFPVRRCPHGFAPATPGRHRRPGTGSWRPYAPRSAGGAAAAGLRATPPRGSFGGRRYAGQPAACLVGISLSGPRADVLAVLDQWCTAVITAAVPDRRRPPMTGTYARPARRLPGIRVPSGAGSIRLEARGPALPDSWSLTSRACASGRVGLGKTADL
jgi:hypothetical protein